MAKEFGCELVKLPVNRGFAAAVNAGIAAGRSRYVTVLNDDVELDRHWLERTVAFLEAHRDLLSPDFWRRMQARHGAREVLDIFPYRQERRLRRTDHG